MSAFFELTPSKQLTKDQREDILKILESKAEQGKIHDKQGYISELAKIVIKDGSVVLRDVLVNKVKNTGRRLTPEELNLAQRAFKKTNLSPETLKEVEDAIVADLQKVNTKSPHLLVSNLHLLNGIQSRDQHNEYAEELLKTLTANSDKLGRNETRGIMKYMQHVQRPSEPSLKLFNIALEKHYSPDAIKNGKVATSELVDLYMLTNLN